MPRTETLAASIRQTFADTERAPPADAIVERTAAFIASCRDLDAAADLAHPFGDLNPEIRGCVAEYREALGEVGSPGRIAQRHMLRASFLRDDADYHATIAADYEASAARYAANGNTVFADQHAASARAGRESAAEALAEAERLEARAKELVTPPPPPEPAAKGIVRHMLASAVAAAPVLAAEFTNGSRRREPVLTLTRIEDGRRTVVQTLVVAGRRDARAEALRAGATPWNF